MHEYVAGPKDVSLNVYVLFTDIYSLFMFIFDKSELKRKRFERTVVKSSLRDWKHSQARSKRYFKDFEGDLKCQLQQLNTAEEQVRMYIYTYVYSWCVHTLPLGYVPCVVHRHFVKHSIKSMVW